MTENGIIETEVVSMLEIWKNLNHSCLSAEVANMKLVPYKIIEQAWADFPIKFKYREDNTLVMVTSGPAYDVESEVAKWFIKWFGVPKRDMS